MEFDIARIRKQESMTQQELSDKSGVGRVTISRLESGKLKETTIGTLSKLAAALEVSVDELIVS